MRRLSLLAAVIALLCLLAAGPGVRLGAWDIGTGFALLRWGAYLGIGAAAMALLLLTRAPWRAGWTGYLAVAVLAGGLAGVVPWYWLQQARGVPPIHDITTDTVDPPPFEAVLPARADAPNSATYGGPEVAAAQAKAYPDIQPLSLSSPPAASFARALETARTMGWEIVAADSATGRIEATATTRWFGFKDDIVIRVRPEERGSRVDVRSESRVGGSDVGTNARRIRAYLARLAANPG
jgi:uncharacterized protein (DUF1499 family)